MKKLNFLTFVFAIFLTAVSFTVVNAQDEALDDGAATQNLKREKRPSLLAELNLLPNQIEQIRRINRENQPLKRQAQERLREARRNLDEAIYAGNLDESEIQVRLKDVQQAHAEVLKVNSSAEIAVRKLLTQEQLVRFRDVRRRFAEQIKTIQNERENRRMNAPDRKLINRQRRMRNN